MTIDNDYTLIYTDYSYLLTQTTMKMTMNFSQFCDNWPESRKDQFSYSALEAIFDYLEEVDENIEFDPIAICCDFTEYENFEEIQANYSDLKDLEDLRDHTTVLDCDNGHIVIINY